MNINRFHGQIDGDKGKLIVEIEDRRGAIRLADDCIAIGGEQDSLSLVGQINDDVRFELVSSETRSVDLESVYNLELWLIAPDNVVIDHCSSTECPYHYPSTPPEK